KQFCRPEWYISSQIAKSAPGSRLQNSVLAPGEGRCIHSRSDRTGEALPDRIRPNNRRCLRLDIRARIVARVQVLRTKFQLSAANSQAGAHHCATAGKSKADPG